MPRTIYTTIRVLFFFVYAYIGLVAARIFTRKSLAEIIPDISHRFSRMVLGLSLTEYVVEGRENLKLLPPGRRVLVISNHESYLDIPCILGLMDFRVGFIAKKELNRIPLLGMWIKQLGGVLLDRQNLRASHAVIKGVFSNSDTGALLVFPEGTRNKTGSVAPFKPGSLRPAFEGNAMILPITLCGGRRKFEGNGYRMKKGRIYCSIHAPVDSVLLSEKKRHESAAVFQSIIFEAYRDFDERLKAAL